MARVTGDDILRKWMGSTKACGKVVVCGAVKRTLMRPPYRCVSQATNAEGCLSFKLKKHTIMKELIDDILNEEFTMREVVVYGFVSPVVLIVVCLLAGA